ncbi:MAG: hypothetical protein EPO39_00415 [Candidatus Manganitrophaceae bacterium]|nr:MAG: hypothetical protein EPO39_00415 [Candidatus Manganitrophaceae bacterium]
MRGTIGLMVLVVSAGLSGCTEHTLTLRNDRGETVQCRGKMDEVNACEKKYEEAGYKPVEEPRVRPAPVGSGY